MVNSVDVCALCGGEGAIEAQTLERKVVSRCRVPHGENRVCGFPFYEGESQAVIEAHTAQCVSDHHDAIVAERRRQHPEILKPWDPEHFKWIRENADALNEGRLKA